MNSNKVQYVIQFYAYYLDNRLRNCGSIPGRGMRFFLLQQHPDQLWAPPSLQFNGQQGLFLQELSGWDMKLTTYLHLEPWLRMHGAIPLFPPYSFMTCIGTHLTFI
jgi:hypothetical protein